MYRYSVVNPSYDLKALIELATRVACHELGCGLPDNIFAIAADEDGALESRSTLPDGMMTAACSSLPPAGSRMKSCRRAFMNVHTIATA